MPNMSYCRFENTARALFNCKEHLDDKNLSESEKAAREELLELCAKIASGDY